MVEMGTVTNGEKYLLFSTFVSTSKSQVIDTDVLNKDLHQFPVFLFFGYEFPQNDLVL